MSVGNRIIKNSGYLYARMAVTMFISLYTTRLVLSALGESEFGVYNVVGGAIGMLGFLNAAMATATQRFMSYTEGTGDTERVKTIFNVSILIHSGLSLIALVVLMVAGYFLFKHILNIPTQNVYSAKIVYACMSASTAISVLAVPYEAVLNAHENMRYYAIVGFIESLLKLLVAIIITNYSHDKLIAYGILMAMIPFVTLIIMRIYCHRKYSECIIKPMEYADKGVFKEMLSFAGWNIFQIAASIITNSGLGIVINIFFGTIINAAQGISNTICGQLMALTNVLNKAINPIITKTEGSNNRIKVIQLSITSTKASFFLTSVLGLPAIIIMPGLLEIWLREVPLYAIFFARCQMIISLCEQTTSGFTTAINATGNIRKMSVWKSVFKISVLPISYILFKFGYSVIFAYIFLVVIQGVFNGIIVTMFCADYVLGFKLEDYIIKVFIPLIAGCAVVLIGGEILIRFFGSSLSSTLLVGSVCVILSIISFYLISLTAAEKKIITNALWTVKSRIIK